MGPSIEYAEGLQVLKYLPDQEYKAHHDYFTSASKASKNNRISTLVMYLNDVEEGGETYFPKLGLSVSPTKGMAVYFEYFIVMLNLMTVLSTGSSCYKRRKVGRYPVDAQTKIRS